jgi:hypothetical protein
MGRFGWMNMSGGIQHPVYVVVRGTRDYRLTDTRSAGI